MSRSILITGCSTGIGLSAADILHKRGYRVFATAQKQSDVDMLQSKGLVDSLLLDVDDSRSIKKGLQEILVKTGGTLDALFNNAGFALPGAVEDITRDMMRSQFETNVFGAMELTNLVLPIMRKQGHGRIIQNISILGIVAFPYYGAYNASKFALEGFSNTLRIELRGTNIFVSIIAPGPVKTDFRKNALKKIHEALGNQSNIHSETYSKLEAKFSSSVSKTEDRITVSPEAVVNKLISALESRKPKARYYVTIPSHVFAFLRRILPDSALDWTILQAANA